MALKKEGIPQYVIDSICESRRCEPKNPYSSPSVKALIKKYQEIQPKK